MSLVMEAVKEMSGQDFTQQLCHHVGELLLRGDSWTLDRPAVSVFTQKVVTDINVLCTWSSSL